MWDLIFDWIHVVHHSVFYANNNEANCSLINVNTVHAKTEQLQLEVFTEDPRPIRVRVYILNGQPGPGRVPIYYFGSRVCLTLCVIPESIREHRTCQWSVSVGTLCAFCNLQLVKLGWEKYEWE